MEELRERGREEIKKRGRESLEQLLCGVVPITCTSETVVSPTEEVTN